MPIDNPVRIITQAHTYLLLKRLFNRSLPRNEASACRARVPTWYIKRPCAAITYPRPFRPVSTPHFREVVNHRWLEETVDLLSYVDMYPAMARLRIQIYILENQIYKESSTRLISRQETASPLSNYSVPSNLPLPYPHSDAYPHGKSTPCSRRLSSYGTANRNGNPSGPAAWSTNPASLEQKALALLGGAIAPFDTLDYHPAPGLFA